MKSSQGFTLIELIVSVGIFGLVTAILVANLHGGERLNDLRLQADLLASHLRIAQSQAVSGINATSTPSYGISISTSDLTQYIVFADGLSGTVHRYDAGEETTVATFSDGIALTTSVDTDIVFTIPSGTVYENGTVQQSTVTQTLTYSDIGKSIDITILPLSGQISVSEPY